MDRRDLAAGAALAQEYVWLAGTALPPGFGAGIPCTGQGPGWLVEEPGAMDHVGGGERQARAFIDHWVLPLAGLVALLAVLLALHLRLPVRRPARNESDVLCVTSPWHRQLASITGWAYQGASCHTSPTATPRLPRTSP